MHKLVHNRGISSKHRWIGHFVKLEARVGIGGQDTVMTSGACLIFRLFKQYLLYPVISFLIVLVSVQLTRLCCGMVATLRWQRSLSDKQDVR